MHAYRGLRFLIPLTGALRETLHGWKEDIDPAWREFVGNVRLGFDDISAELVIEPWEPIFPTRRGKKMPGEPNGAHMLRAFDGIRPEEVRCVLLGQDPYPCPAFSTGRAFEAGNTGGWRELDKMFSRSVRAFMLQIAAARTGRTELASTFGQWPRLIAAVETGRIVLESPAVIADRWVESGVLLLNSSLTLSRFSVDVDPHQSQGHLPLWRPLILAILGQLAARHSPIAVIAFGDSAADNVRRAGITEKAGVQVFERPHPAFADEFLACENPFLACNAHLRRSGVTAVNW